MSSADRTFTNFPALADLFPPPSLDDWRQAAEASLGGRSPEELTVTTLEGLTIPPLYTAADAAGQPGYPGQPPFVRGRTPFGPGAPGWEVCQRVDHPDPATAADRVAGELARGASSVWLVFDPATRLSDADVLPPAGSGLHLRSSGDFDALFEAVDLASMAVHLDAGGNTAAVAAAFLAAARRHDVNTHSLTGSLGWDPLGALAADGELCAGLDGSFDLLAELASWTERHAPGLRAVTISTIPYHMAGATAVQELAYALATGVDVVRALAGLGLAPARACRQIGFRHAVGRDLFIEAAKLRAARRLWSRAAGACGVPAEHRQAPIHAVASPRCLTTRDPWVNGLRTTVGSFAAVVGGADLLTVLPFDAAIGLSDDLARRMATSCQTILREESHLGRVVDPGGGSWYLEKLADDLARAAWGHFQRIEADGGMRPSLAGGGVARELAATQVRRVEAVATRRDPVTGVSSYPNLAEKVLERPQPAAGERPPHRGGGAAVAELARLLQAAASPMGDGAVIDAAMDAASAGAAIDQLAAALCATRNRTSMPPLPAEREAQIFERLRDASDAWLATRGVRPRIFLANMGPVADHKPRAAFAVNVFEAGGIEAVTNDGFDTAAEAAAAFADAGTQMAVICSTDERYLDVVPELAPALEARGARTVLLAGRPGRHEQAWLDAGVTGFLYPGCDVYQLLVDLLQEEGVLHV